MSSITSNSAFKSLRPGLCIDIPTIDSAGMKASETSPTFRAHSASTSSSHSGTQSRVMRISSESYNSASNIRPCLISRPLLSHSSTEMQGGLVAETGGELVELDLGSVSGFRQGTAALVSPGGGTSAVVYPHADMHSTVRSKAGANQRLIRHATLLSQDGTPARSAAELKYLLGNSKLKIKSGAKLLPPSNSPHLSLSADAGSAAVALEQGKSRARVEVDILLDSEMCVEGGYLTGRLHVKVRKVRANETAVLIAGGKVRIVGFEGIPANNDRHTFYQHSALLSNISSSSHILYSSDPDDEGFAQAREGQHVVPFAMKLPISEDAHAGAKGPFDNRSGVMVKYIAVASFKLKDSASQQSIAHFYRKCEIYPYINSTLVLAPAINPLFSTASGSVLLGGPGKLNLTANLHRNIWVAGQRCCVGIAVDNESKKSVKSVTLSLIRTTTIFVSHPNLDVASSSSADRDACQTTTTRKLVAETILESGQRGLKGHVTEKGWWVGVDPGTRARFTHFILLPHDTLSIVRSRLLEVSYAIRVGIIAGSLSSDVSVMLPLHIISNLSIDPPPSYPAPFSYPRVSAPVSHLPLSAVGFETASRSPALPRNMYPLDSQPGTRPDLKGQTSLFNKVLTRGVVPAYNALHDRDLPRERSYMMLKLAEEDLDLERTGCSSNIVSGCPRSDDASEDSRFHTLQLEDGNADKAFSHVMSDEPVDDFTMNLLRNLILDDETNSFVGSAGLDDHDGYSLETAAEDSQAEPYFEDEPKAVMESPSTNMNELDRHTGSRYTSSRLPKNLAPGEITAITAPCPALRPKVPYSPSSVTTANGLPQAPARKATPNYRSSEVYTAKGSNDALTSSERSLQGGSPFSQRVEKLLAARRGATASTTSVPVSGNEDCTLGVDRDPLVSSPNQRSSLMEPHLCALPSSASLIRCPPILMSSTSKLVMSDNTILATSLSGSVRARIAELEGRTAVACGSNFGRVPG